VGGDDEHPSRAPTTPDPSRDAAKQTTPGTSKSQQHGPRRKTDLSGAVIADRYKIIGRLGEGGMGVVYVAEHVKLEKRVAVKVLSGEFSRRGELVSRFLQEAKAATRIGHENIINVTDFGETGGGEPFIVMELLDGRDLARVVRGETAMSIERTADIITQVCRGVGAAHEKGIFHRDLKPENIFLVDKEARPDFVKILDFGIAKVSALGDEARLTRTGTIFGTAEYMSPEQAEGRDADHRSDIYSVGCILYEMLTGDVPFKGESFMATLQKQLAAAPEPPSKRAPGRVTPALEAVVLKALAKRRENRFQSLAELSSALSAALLPGAKPIDVGDAMARTPLPSRARASYLLLGAAMLLGGGFAAGTWMYLQSRMRAQSPPPVAAPANVAPSNVAPSNVAPSTVAPSTVAPPTLAPSGAVAVNVAATAKVEESHISIASHPSGADVKAGDGERFGKTPFARTWPRSSDSFEVTLERHGYATQKLRIVPDRDHEYVVELQPARRSTEKPIPAAPTTIEKPAEAAPDKKVPAELKSVE
jgi:eukaryotic-like serine/threonine-protein kinase